MRKAAKYAWTNETNFFSYLLLAQMADGGVVTRYRGTELHCEECIRVTIGKPEENEVFLTKMQHMWAKINP